MVLFSTILATFSIAQANHDRFFEDVTFQTVSQFTDSNGIKVTYKGPSEKDFSEFKSVFLETALRYRSFADTGEAVCKNIILTVYDIPYEMLNDKKRTAFVDWEGRNRVYGFYDKVDAGPGEVGMFLSYSDEIKDFQRQYIMAHESAHYWQDILCQERPVSEIEAEATAYGKYFISLH